MQLISIYYMTVFRTSVKSEGYRVHPWIIGFIPELSIPLYSGYMNSSSQQFTFYFNIILQLQITPEIQK